VKGLPYTDFAPLRYDRSGLTGREGRLKAFQDLQVSWVGAPNGQLFPYEIYGDLYGQRVIPENLGNPQPFENRHVTTPRTLDEIIAAARRNIKLRDVWGSLFFHPQLTNSVSHEGVGAFPGDATEMKRLINEMRAMGYEFIDLEKFIDQAGDAMRPDPQVVPRSAARDSYSF
jgi:hypothetical protein